MYHCLQSILFRLVVVTRLLQVLFLVVTGSLDLLQACLTSQGSLSFANHLTQWSRYIYHQQGKEFLIIRKKLKAFYRSGI